MKFHGGIPIGIAKVIPSGIPGVIPAGKNFIGPELLFGISIFVYHPVYMYFSVYIIKYVLVPPYATLYRQVLIYCCSSKSNESTG